MTTTTPTKTEGTSVLALQSVSGSSVVVSSTIDVSGKFAGVLGIFFARTTTTAATVGVTYRVEGLMVGSGGVGDWVPLTSYTTGFAQCNGGNTLAITATSSATLTITANGTSATAGQRCYAKDGTLANSEWFYVLSSTSTTVVAQQNFTNNHTGNNVFNQAETPSLYLDLSSVSHIRVTVDGSQHNQGFDTKVFLDTLDSLGTV